MSEISRKIIDTVRSHLNEYGVTEKGLRDTEISIPLEGDLESDIDSVLLDAVFPIKEAADAQSP